jgi:tRNA 5-methylaminomethyl-2-thiouridine biosynthesis bifunctional protein
LVAESTAAQNGAKRHVIFTDEFGDGDNFLSAWSAWRADQKHAVHATQLYVISIVDPELSAQQLTRNHSCCKLRNQLVQAWPALAPRQLHRISFEQGQVQLLLAPGLLTVWWAKLAFQAHELRLQSSVWVIQAEHGAKTLARWSALHANLEWMAEGVDPLLPEFHNQLHRVGFEIKRSTAESICGQLLARYTPRFTTKRAPSRSMPAPTPHRHALIVGAGLAGSAAAWALAEHGWHSTILEREAGPAFAASGNFAGLFHGVVHGQDGCHARFNRAAALESTRVVGQLLMHQLDADSIGSIQGLLRLETHLPTVQAMQDLLVALQLPTGYVQALSQTQASEHCGVALPGPAWFYPGGGWVKPTALVAHYLAQAAGYTQLKTNQAVHSLCHVDGSWQALNERGQVIDESSVLVLANAQEAWRLMRPHSAALESISSIVRGQLSMVQQEHCLASSKLKRAVAGAGYVLPGIEGWMVFGATAQLNDRDPQVREQDHQLNKAQLSKLSLELTLAEHCPVAGRTQWRCVSRDRLPLVGALPDTSSLAPSNYPGLWSQPRWVPRLPGVYIIAALGSRGITWSALAAQTLAASISGAPSPLDQNLLDAIDPARFVSRLMACSKHA